MAATAPDGWMEVFRGPCVRAEVIQAVLEAHGLRPVLQRFGPQGWWSGTVLEDCAVYVLGEEAVRAREALSEHGAAPEE
ncbi:MAG TPA: hypothetical protein VKY90_01805 [Candidatus Dormibacteraeota bacterium]|nr:hypothetical protein [Candidatus Dormibacteraeota bacterium]